MEPCSSQGNRSGALDLIMKRVPFVKAKQTDTEEPCKQNHVPPQWNNRDSEREGAEAKAFYEALISDDKPDTSGDSSRSEQNEMFQERTVWKDVRYVGKVTTTEVCEDEKSPVVKNEHVTKRRRSPRSRVMTRAEVDLEARLRKGSSDFLRSAQQGDLDALQRHLGRGLDINTQDQYGWTALMCAVHEGHTESVQFLLERGANVYIADNQGRNAMRIAEATPSGGSEKNQGMDCRIMLKSFMAGESDWRMNSEDTQSEHEDFFCEECQQAFSDTTRAKHNTTTIHLFNNKPRGAAGNTFYHLAENNKGYKLMVESGWDKNKGLGPEGKEGQKFPVKTVLKRDRLGLGNVEKPKAKVTHFAPFDEAAVKRPKRLEMPADRIMKKSTLSKRQRAKQLSKEQEKEMKFRLEFYTDS